MNTRVLLSFILVIALFFTTSPHVKAIQGSIGAHDPSSIVKDGNNYYIFCTGNGPYCLTSTDLINWTTSSISPYTSTNWPSWITTYATGFDGFFWAPECIYMNGKYYLFYACSTWASKNSCIGLATTPSLNNPVWTDQGVVVYSTSSSDYNAIDPDVFQDASGNLWLTYGSWNTGIKMQQLNSSTGKPLNSTVYSVCTFTDAENSQVIRNGSYYYLFVNRGLCCQGTNSTYYIQVGRATSPTGPYSGWRTVLGNNSTFIGPGALGYYSGDGAEWATYHYYDSRFNGAPTLAVGRFTWSGGWPTVTLDWFSNGTYRLTNVNSGLVWDAWGCTGASGQAIAQGSWNSLLCQKWDFTSLGNGFYKITCGLGGLSADASNCSDAWGTKLGLYSYWGGTCQQFQIERTNTGSYVISQAHSSGQNNNPVVEVPNASTVAGVQLGLWGYSGNNCQKWTITGTTKSSTYIASNEVSLSESPGVYPSPASDMIHLTGIKIGSRYSIYSSGGALIDQGTIILPSLDVTRLKSGLYFIKLSDSQTLINLRFVKQ